MVRKHHSHPRRHRVRRIMDAIQVGAATAAAIVELVKAFKH